MRCNPTVTVPLWRGEQPSICSVHQAMYPCSPRVVLQTWTVSGEPLVSSPQWKAGNADSDISGGSSCNERDRLRGKREGQLSKRQKGLPPAVSFEYGLPPEDAAHNWGKSSHINKAIRPVLLSLPNVTEPSVPWDGSTETPFLLAAQSSWGGRSPHRPLSYGTLPSQSRKRPFLTPSLRGLAC